jgi:hypothetical protein
MSTPCYRSGSSSIYGQARLSTWPRSAGCTLSAFGRPSTLLQSVLVSGSCAVTSQRGETAPHLLKPVGFPGSGATPTLLLESTVSPCHRAPAWNRQASMSPGLWLQAAPEPRRRCPETPHDQAASRSLAIFNFESTLSERKMRLYLRHNAVTGGGITLH